MIKYLQCTCVLLWAFVFAFTCDSAVAQATPIEKRGWKLTCHDE
ncbi:MAG: hypothetical protein JWO20_894, partial [Candidatus Angelobacter sp.]|nr:hypothetical protein [Candidatus Angelobacter sp.]